MIDFGLTEEYLSGYNARLKNQSFDENKPDDWKMGWMNSHQALKTYAERTDAMLIRSDQTIRPPPVLYTNCTLAALALPKVYSWKSLVVSGANILALGPTVHTVHRNQTHPYI